MLQIHVKRVCYFPTVTVYWLMYGLLSPSCFSCTSWLCVLFMAHTQNSGAQVKEHFQPGNGHELTKRCWLFRLQRMSDIHLLHIVHLMELFYICQPQEWCILSFDHRRSDRKQLHLHFGCVFRNILCECRQRERTDCPCAVQDVNWQQCKE